MSQKAKNFILLVEIVERELPASVLVGAELAARGHNVWLIEKGRFRKSPASFPPSFVLEKGLSKGCLSRFRSIRGAGHVLGGDVPGGFHLSRRARTISNGAFTPRRCKQHRLFVPLGRAAEEGPGAFPRKRTGLSRDREPAP